MAKKLDVTTGKAVNYEYDSLGRLIHSYQTDNDVVQQRTEHLYDTENRLVRQTWTSGGENHVMDFIYDNTGKPYAVKYDNQIFYYVLNLQGDVIAIVTTWGAAYGTYTYDAWGNIISQSGTMAAVNPIRYRGYYYDSETGLYYLGSRYYDPAVKRFMNADGAAFATINPYGDGLTDKNYFAYCNNNPVMQKDDDGELGHIAVGAIIGGVLGAGLEVASQIIGGKSSIDWVSVGIEAANGALTGALVAAGLPPSTTVAGKALINGATAMSHTLHEGKGTKDQVVNNAVKNGYKAAATSVLVGGAANTVAPKVANHISKLSGLAGKYARLATNKIWNKTPMLVKKGLIIYGTVLLAFHVLSAEFSAIGGESKQWMISWKSCLSWCMD